MILLDLKVFFYMDNLKSRVLAELENIDEIFGELPRHTKLPYISTLELAGVVALIHNFYNGIGNIQGVYSLFKKVISKFL